MLSLTENLTFGNFTLPFCGLRQRIVPKCVPHVQQDSFSSFNQSDHYFLASLPLASSLPTFPILRTPRRPCLCLGSNKRRSCRYQSSKDSNQSSKDSTPAKKKILSCLKREENTILVDLDCKNPRILYFPSSDKSKTGLPGFWNPSRAFQPSSPEVLNSCRMCQYTSRFS